MPANGQPKYPDCRVKLTGSDGNAFAILGAVKRAMKKGGCTSKQINEYVREATSGDYNDLLAVTMKTVWVD